MFVRGTGDSVLAHFEGVVREGDGRRLPLSERRSVLVVRESFRRRTAPEHETRVAAYSSARARLVVLHSTARRECIASSWPCTPRIAMLLGAQLAFGAKRPLARRNLSFEGR